jgi:threonyl-tRNA synthetase
MPLINPLTLGVTRDTGNDINIVIAPQLTITPQTITSDNIFELYLSAEETDDGYLSLSEPVFLGRILFDKNGHWIYDSDLLTVAEQEQIADCIINYDVDNVDY